MENQNVKEYDGLGGVGWGGDGQWWSKRGKKPNAEVCEALNDFSFYLFLQGRRYLSQCERVKFDVFGSKVVYKR